ncbi:alpha/beta fold hydrolase [Phytoactinopolyspora endophytica]|uniref:alpha/beta fold hydrolase n=1 Tax=Phytoactinopolyspora endophytica TaxID=1642495 RepID=UPI00197CB1EA|nr:alpha/beta hydrolase [Phytoactinopolyspora endophytica]
MSDEIPTTAQSASTAGMPILRVEEAGSGPPLILVHGSWDDRHVWELVVDSLTPHFHVVTYDRRGHTDSHDGPTPGTRHDDEDDLAGLINDLDLTPANVVGNSFGASIALGLAARRPELFNSLCVHEPPLLTLAADQPAVAEVSAALHSVCQLIEGDNTGAAARDFVENVALGPGAWKAMPAQERASMITNAPTFAGEQRDPGWADIDLAALRALDLPVLLTQGDQSPPFFSTVVTRLATTIHTAQVETLPGAGHVPQATHPAEYATLVHRFAASVIAGQLRASTSER